MNTETFHIKPARPDLVVCDPVTRQALAAAGEEKPRDTYWLRRLREGDVVELEAAAAATKPASKAK